MRPIRFKISGNKQEASSARSSFESVIDCGHCDRSRLGFSARSDSEGQAAQAGQPAAGGGAEELEATAPNTDLYNAIAKEQDPAKRIALLNSWKEKYPTSDYALQRQDIYCQTYAAMNQPAKVLEAGKEALQIDPKDLTVLFLMAQNVLGLTKPTPDDLDAGEKAANGLLSNLDSFFDTSKKPPTTSDADWAKAKNQTEDAGAHRARMDRPSKER